MARWFNDLWLVFAVISFSYLCFLIISLFSQFYIDLSCSYIRNIVKNEYSVSIIAVVSTATGDGPGDNVITSFQPVECCDVSENSVTIGDYTACVVHSHCVAVLRKQWTSVIFFPLSNLSKVNVCTGCAWRSIWGSICVLQYENEIISGSSPV
jgi:hypothetical protein